MKGNGQVLKLERVAEDQPASEVIAVRITNWDECAEVFSRLFDQWFEAKKRSDDRKSSKSPLPSGSESGREVERMLSEFLNRHRRQFVQLAEDTLAGVPGAKQRFQKRFGATAIARQWIRETGITGDVPKEVNRLTTAIQRVDEYKTQIQPLLRKTSQWPEGWERPEGNADPLLSELRRRSDDADNR